MLYVYDALLEINGDTAKKCLQHSDEYIRQHVLVRKDITKLWFFYKYSHKILYPLTINYNDRTDFLILSPGINRYFGLMLAGLSHAPVKLFSTAEYEQCQGSIRLTNVRRADSYIPVVLQILSENQHYNIEFKDSKHFYYDYFSSIAKGVNVYSNDKLLFNIGTDIEKNKNIYLKDDVNFTEILRDACRQVDTITD